MFFFLCYEFGRESKTCQIYVVMKGVYVSITDCELFSMGCWIGRSNKERLIVVFFWYWKYVDFLHPSFFLGCLVKDHPMVKVASFLHVVIFFLAWCNCVTCSIFWHIKLLVLLAFSTCLLMLCLIARKENYPTSFTFLFFCWSFCSYLLAYWIDRSPKSYLYFLYFWISSLFQG